MNLDGRIRALRSQIEDGFSAKLHRVAVSLYRVDNDELSSGTLFLYADRLFVITCQHTLPNEPHRRMMVVRDSKGRPEEGFPGIINHFEHAGGHPDVALLELNPDMLGGYLNGYRPIGMDDIGNLDYAVESHSTPVVVGNPSEKVTHFRRADGAVWGIEIGIEYYCHNLVKPPDWPPPLPGDRPDDPTRGLYLKSIRKDCDEEEAKRFEYRNPMGLSGGGIWVHRVIGGEIWSPSEIRLVGVQSSWDRRGFLHGTRIESVLELMSRS